MGVKQTLQFISYVIELSILLNRLKFSRMSNETCDKMKCHSGSTKKIDFQTRSYINPSLLAASMGVLCCHSSKMASTIYLILLIASGAVNVIVAEDPQPPSSADQGSVAAPASAAGLGEGGGDHGGDGDNHGNPDDQCSTRDKCGAIILEIRGRLSKVEERTTSNVAWRQEAIAVVDGWIALTEKWIRSKAKTYVFSELFHQRILMSMTTVFVTL